MECQSTLDNLKKTGLGSSAALTSSLVASVMAFFDVLEVPRLDSRVANCEQMDWFHNVAQLCHCLAQGKIGSGFDISAAVYGSQCFVRFDKAALEPLLQQTINSDVLFNYLQPSDSWNGSHSRFTLPYGLSLMLGDVNVGSHTPSMVSKILQWRREHTDVSLALWRELALSNEAIASAFSDLQAYFDSNQERYVKELNELVKSSATTWKGNPTALAASMLRYIKKS